MDLICLIIQGIFDIIAIVLFYLLKVVTDNQEELLFTLRDEINVLKLNEKGGHIFCKSYDDDYEVIDKVKDYKGDTIAIIKRKKENEE